MSQRHSQRSGHSLAPYEPPIPVRKERSKCTTVLCMSWKFFTCVFSHVMLVALVVSYCILGAYTFQRLEGENEIMVKQGIRLIRDNFTEVIWQYTDQLAVLDEKNFTTAMEIELKNFEISLLDAMKKNGWDGNENMDQMQWTFAGSLFYSIIVITTIGYGHIAPKTSYGKVTTIFYAILGIPLMLLCLSNIGDIMASSFRFLYWRVCCFVCTREPKRPRRARSVRGTIRQSAGRSLPRGSVRRPERFSQRSYDSGIVPWAEPAMAHAYSDTDLRYSFMERSNYHLPDVESRGSTRPSSQRFSRDNKDRFRDRHTVERERNVAKSSRYEDDTMVPPPPQHKYNTTGRINKDPQTPKSRRNSRSMGLRSQSLDRKARKETPDVDFDRENPTDSNVFCNKYAIDEMQRGSNRQRHSNRDRFQNRIRQNHNRSQSVPRPIAGNQLELPTPSPPRRTQSSYSQYNNYDDAEEDGEMELQPMRRSPRKKQREVLPPSPRIMSPMGFQTHRQARYEDLPFYDDDPDYFDLPPRSRPVPIWLCVFLVVSYIIAGAFIFSNWENWSLLDSAYFCFITLTTIGFGDFVPSQGLKTGSEASSIAQCSLYLLFGIALLAMSFNLVQEEVIANVKGIARRLGILKEEEIND